MEKTNSGVNEKIKQYVDRLSKALKEDPKSLTDVERRLASRAEANRAAATKCNEEITRLLDQVKQAQARIRSLEVQAESLLGKASGLYESLAVTEFDLDSATEISTESVERPEPPETNA